MRKEGVIIIGQERLAKRSVDILENQNYILYGCLYTSEKPPELKTLNEVPFLGYWKEDKWQKLLKEEKDMRYVLAIESSEERETLYEQLLQWRDQFPMNVVHTTVLKEKSAAVGQGNIIDAYTLLSSNSIIEGCNYIGPKVIVGEGVHIHHFNTIEAGVIIGHHVQIGSHTYIGHGAILHPGVVVGDEAYIAAGSVVMRSVPPGTKWFGVPAKELEE